MDSHLTPLSTSLSLSLQFVLGVELSPFSSPFISILFFFLLLDLCELLSHFAPAGCPSALLSSKIFSHPATVDGARGLSRPFVLSFPLVFFLLCPLDVWTRLQFILLRSFEILFSLVHPVSALYLISHCRSLDSSRLDPYRCPFSSVFSVGLSSFSFTFCSVI